MCQTAGGSIVRCIRVPHEGKGFHALHMDPPGLHVVSETDGGKAVSYALVAALRLQDKTHRLSLLLPWACAVRTKEQGEVPKGTESILDDIAGVPR